MSSLLESRYPDHRRPDTWDKRVEGIDVVTTVSGETVRLASDGGQSPPEAGWTLVLTSGDDSTGYRWTLFGISTRDAAAPISPSPHAKH